MARNATSCGAFTPSLRAGSARWSCGLEYAPESEDSVNAKTKANFFIGNALLWALLGACASQQSPAPKQSPASQPAAKAETPKQHAKPGHHHRAHHHLGPKDHKGSMPHRFANAEKWAKRFESSKRAMWQKPMAVISKMKLTPKMHIADIGSATGYFAVRFAKAVPQGKVLGIDIETDMVRYLNQRARKEGLKNLVSHQGRANDPNLNQAVDVIFVCDTYHHISGRIAYFKRLLPKLNEGGRLVIVDFKLGKIPVGPPENHRIAPVQLDKELSAAGYQRLSVDASTLPYQYIAIYGRK